MLKDKEEVQEKEVQEIREIDEVKGFQDKEEVQKIMAKLEELSDRIQEMNLAEYIELVRSPRRMLFINFISGLARGLGGAIGATVLGALFLTVLLRLAQTRIPIIAEFVARIIKIVQTYL